MRRAQKTKHALVASAVSMVMCCALLLGTTFAWFTDSVTNEGNSITAGTLGIQLNAGSEDKLFTSDGSFLWEPGRSQKASVELKNIGSLWLKYELRFSNVKVQGSTEHPDADITSVLDVYKVPAKEDGSEVTAEDLNQENYLGTMKDLMADTTEAEGVLAPNGQTGTVQDGTVQDEKVDDTDAFTLVIKMQDTAGNEYQNTSVDFDIVANATQYTYETDGLGNNDYDQDAVFSQVNVDATEDAGANGQALQDALDKAEPDTTVYLSAGTYDAVLHIDKPVVIVGDEAVLTDKVTVNTDGVKLDGIKMEIEMTSAEQSAPIVTKNHDLTLKNCEIVRTTQTAQPYGMLVDAGTGTLVAKNTVFKAPYDPEKAFRDSPSVLQAGEVDLDGCVIATDGYGLFSQHVTTGVIKNTLFTGIDGRPTYCCFNSTLLNGLVFDGCTFDMGKSSIVSAGNFTVKNCTFDFTNTPQDGAGNGINLYAQNGPVVLENNTFKLQAGKVGINLTYADWAKGTYDASKVTITGNVFEGTGATAIKISDVWVNEGTVEDYTSHNTMNGNTVVIN